jgi:hypothetical protein
MQQCSTPAEIKSVQNTAETQLCHFSPAATDQGKNNTKDMDKKCA